MHMLPSLGVSWPWMAYLTMSTMAAVLFSPEIVIMPLTRCLPPSWQALEDAITEQHEQERSIENEIEAYRKDIVREQIRNEQLTAVMTKLEGESGFLRTQNDSMVKKQEKLQVSNVQCKGINFVRV